VCERLAVSKWSCLAARVGQPGWACGHARQPCNSPWREPGADWHHTHTHVSSPFWRRHGGGREWLPASAAGERNGHVWDAVMGSAPLGAGVGAPLHLHGAWSHLAQVLMYVRALAEQQARDAPLTDAGAAAAQPWVRSPGLSV